MKGKLKIATKILFVTVTVTVLVILISGLVAIRGSKDSLREEAINKLTAVREMKAQQIEDYMRIIRGQAVTVAENRMVIEAMRDFRTGFQSLASGIDTGTVETGGDDEILRNY